MTERAEKVYQALMDLGLSEDEINSQIDEKLTEYQGFMTKEGAIYLIGKEKGIDVYSSDSNIQKEIEALIDYNDFVGAFRQLEWHRVDGCRNWLGGFPDFQDDICLPDLAQAAFHTDAFDRIVAVAQARRIDDVQRQPRYDQFTPQNIARRSWHLGDDCHLFFGKPVHQARLANVRRAGQHDLYAFTQ